MGEIIEFQQLTQTEEDEELFAYVERTEKFFESAKKLSDYIKALPISREQNDELIELVKKHILYAEDGAYSYGMQQGAQLIIDEMAEQE